MFKKLLFTLISTLLITQNSFANEVRQPFEVSDGMKRINTADCPDKDDWYLDGFTVTQKHPQHKEKLLKQRIDYCTKKFGPVSEEMIKEWHVGEKAYIDSKSK